jgi:hypothetical protein
VPDGWEPAPLIPEIRNLDGEIEGCGDGEIEGCGNGRQMVGGAGIPTRSGRRDGAWQWLNWRDDEEK